MKIKQSCPDKGNIIKREQKEIFLLIPPSLHVLKYYRMQLMPFFCSTSATHIAAEAKPTEKMKLWMEHFKSHWFLRG